MEVLNNSILPFKYTLHVETIWKTHFVVCKRILDLIDHKLAAVHKFKLRERVIIKKLA